MTLSEIPTVVISFKDVPGDEEVREAIEKRSRHLSDEFPEITRIAITLSEDGGGFSAHGHVSAKNTDSNTHAEAKELGPAAEKLFDRIERQMRRVHDKRIFEKRREAQKDPPKRKAQS